MRTDAMPVLHKEVSMPTQPNHSPSTGSQTTQVDHTHEHVRMDFERLDCYQVALQFTTFAARLAPRGHRTLRDQLSRAALSIPLNIAESAGRSTPADKTHFIAIARGSAMERGAIVDVLLTGGVTAVGLCREARTLLVRVAQMLTKLEALHRGAVGLP
jgi:four helix bundle protein